MVLLFILVLVYIIQKDFKMQIKKIVILGLVIVSTQTQLWGNGNDISFIENHIKNVKCDKKIEKETYTICYSYKHKGVLSGWTTLYADTVNSKNLKKREKFYSDTSIPKKYRSNYSDYTGYGRKWNRGHFVVADADMDYSRKSLIEAYSMANIIPQSAKVNQRTWLKVERYGRKLATRLGEVNSLSIAVYDRVPKKIKNSVSIPKTLYRAYWSKAKGFASCFKYENILLSSRQAKQDKLKNHKIPCSMFLSCPNLN